MLLDQKPNQFLGYEEIDNSKDPMFSTQKDMINISACD